MKILNPIHPRYAHLGILIMRVGLGAMMMLHGIPKLAAPERWAKLGSNMKYLGLDFAPAFWGFMAGFAEGIGGLLVLLGLGTRFAAGLIVFTMLIASINHMANPKKPDGMLIMEASHSIEVGLAFLGLALIGPGRFSIDYYLTRRQEMLS